MNAPEYLCLTDGAKAGPYASFRWTEDRSADPRAAHTPDLVNFLSLYIHVLVLPTTMCNGDSHVYLYNHVALSSCTDQIHCSLRSWDLVCSAPRQGWQPLYRLSYPPSPSPSTIFKFCKSSLLWHDWISQAKAPSNVNMRLKVDYHCYTHGEGMNEARRKKVRKNHLPQISYFIQFITFAGPHSWYPMFLSRKFCVFLGKNISTPPVWTRFASGRESRLVYLNTNIYYPSQEEQAEERDDQIQIILADYFACTKRCNVRIGWGSTKDKLRL